MTEPTETEDEYTKRVTAELERMSDELAKEVQPVLSRQWREMAGLGTVDKKGEVSIERLASALSTSLLEVLMRVVIDEAKMSALDALVMAGMCMDRAVNSAKGAIKREIIKSLSKSLLAGDKEVTDKLQEAVRSASSDDTVLVEFEPEPEETGTFGTLSGAKRYGDNTCPCCGTKTNTEIHVGNVGRPFPGPFRKRPGDVVLCTECGWGGVIAADGMHRAWTEEEKIKFESEPMIRDAQQQLRDKKRARAH